MKLQRQLRCFAFLASFIAATVTAATAASPLFDKGVAHYKAGQYKDAVGEFKQVTASYPTNALSHYYLALCYQALGNRAEARQEFTLTSQYGDASLKSYAARAMGTLTASTQSTPTSATASGASSNADEFKRMGMAAAAMASSGGQSTAVAANSRASQVAQVLEFYTTWCHVCQGFEPIWTETQQKMPGIQFQQFNAEDGSNAQLVQKYNVTQYPTLVYLDKSGNVLKRLAGAYNTSNDFMTSIRFPR
ncbi:MAG TPA: thioredoxin domain-containing protein [Oculatellaceae cyanobacterium]